MGKLFQRIVSFENLYSAAWEVFRGKRSYHKANQLFLNLEPILLKLQAELLDDSYRTGVYRTFWIFDPKPRMISASSLRDRIVHHAVVRVIEPIFEKRFIYHSYACRKGKGNYRALQQFIRWARNTKY